MKFKEVLKKLKQDGWGIVDQNGSHVQLKHQWKKGRVTLPKHSGKDIPIGTLKKYCKTKWHRLPIEQKKRHILQVYVVYYK